MGITKEDSKWKELLDYLDSSAQITREYLNSINQACLQYRAVKNSDHIRWGFFSKAENQRYIARLDEAVRNFDDAVSQSLAKHRDLQDRLREDLRAKLAQIDKMLEVNMPDLQDYSGEFKPDLKLTDFSKEALIRLLVAAGKLYLGADGMWTTVIRRRFGDDVALSCSKEVWDTNWKQELRRPTEAMNIKGNDIASMFKFFQIDPGFAVMFDIEFELRENGNYGLMTVKRCRTLEYCERHGDDWLLNLACNELDQPLIPETARFFNPGIKTKALKLPPRKSKGEIACQWEFRLKPKK